jgi:N utilization substance protein A
MPKKEQSRLESFSPGERVRVMISRVEKAAKGPQVVASRAVPELVTHLFQTEVPEIYDNTVVIRAIAREAGERTKIAVMSKDKDVDPVGACVGMKGMRVQSIIRELRGEKIDIIEYHEDPVTFAEKALQPAKVSRVTVLEGQDKHLEVIVDDSQLSLAIGKKGQNVRLAAKLLGWKIDIKSEEEKRQEVEAQMSQVMTQTSTPLESVPDLEEGIIEKLVAAGITTVEQVADMTPEQLEEIPGVGPKTVEKISIAVNNYFSSLDAAAAEGEAAERAEGVAVEAGEGVEAEAPATEAGEGSETTEGGEAPLEGAFDEPGDEETSLSEEEAEIIAEGEAELPAERVDAGDLTELPDEPEASNESVEELVDEGQYFEAEVVDGVENAPNADEAEVITHERPEVKGESVPEEEEPGERRQ